MSVIVGATTIILILAACSANESAPHPSASTGDASSTAPGPQKTGPSLQTASPTAAVASSRARSAQKRKPISALAEARKACPSLLSWDNFHRSDRSLHRDQLPTGQRYYASGPDAQRIRHDRYVSDVQGTPDILYVWLDRRPATLAARWVFTEGETSNEKVVMGVAPRHAVIGPRHLLGFGIGSVQLAISPEYWRLFYLVDNQNKLSYITVGTGYFTHPLLQDGRTPYRMTMTFKESSPSVSITFPGGHRVFPNEAFKGLWGKLFGLQVVRSSSEGNAQFLAAGSSMTPCNGTYILGRLRTSG